MSSRMRRNFRPSRLLAVLLWVVASLPGDELERIQKSPENLWIRIFLSDPFMHFSVFGLLTLLMCREYFQESGRAIPAVRIGVLASGYGVMIEIYQAILPWRSFGLDDLTWNTVGVLFFLALVKWGLHLTAPSEEQGYRVRKG